MSIEKYLEKKLVEWVRSIGGEAFKGPSAQYRGIPDRIVVLPMGGGTVWVEVKGGTDYGLTPMQVQFKKRLKDSNPNRYFVIDTKEDLERLIAICKCYIAESIRIWDSEAHAVSNHFMYFKTQPDAPVTQLSPDEIIERDNDITNSMNVHRRKEEVSNDKRNIN